MRRVFVPVFVKAVLAAAAVFLSTAGQAQNVNVSRSALFDGEPYMAVNPANAKNIVVAWMGFAAGNKTVSLKTKCSFDGGKTWGSQYVQPHINSAYQSADPSMAWHHSGTLYLTYIDYQQSPAEGGVYITSTADGGKTWASAVKVWDANEVSKLALDRPWLVVDNSGTATDGMLYVTTKPAPWVSAPCRPYLKFSKDGGKTWSPYKYVDSTGYLVGPYIQAPMASPGVGADGAFYAIYPSYLASQNLLPQSLVTKTTDGGKTFTYYSAITGLTSVKDSGAKLGYRLACNPANKDQLAVCFVDSKYGDADIFTAASNDGGAHWGTMVRINDDTQGNGITQDMPWCGYDSKGRLYATWRDRRNGSGSGMQQPFDVYAAISSDNGSTFSKNVKLTDTASPFAALLLNNGNDFLCSYEQNDTIHAVWGDMRTGKLNIFYTETSLGNGHTSAVNISSEPVPEYNVWLNGNQLTIDLTLSENEPVEITIFNIQGKRLMHIPAKTYGMGSVSIPVDVSMLAAGGYLVQVSADEFSFSRKIIKP